MRAKKVAEGWGEEEEEEEEDGRRKNMLSLIIRYVVFLCFDPCSHRPGGESTRQVS